MLNSCLKTSAWWSRGSHFVENGYLTLRFPNMVKVNIHEHWTRVTRFNPLAYKFLVKHIQRQQFSFTKTSINKSVSKNPESSSLKLKFTDVLRRLPVVCFFQRWTLDKKIARSSIFAARIITNYSLERFLSICCEKMSKGFVKFCKLTTNLILGQIIVSNLTNLRKLNTHINYARLL